MKFSRETQAPEAAVPADAEAGHPRGAKLRPLAALMPYVGRYRGRVAAAFVALVVAALATLAVPVAVRRMIDFGFTAEGVALIDSYFLVMIAVAGVLALAGSTW
jgi:ATP-binding cassette subfamily B protein